MAALSLRWAAHTTALDTIHLDPRRRPNLKSGDLVYARVESASRDLDPELSCVDQVQRAMGFGILKSGCLIEVSTGLARR